MITKNTSLLSLIFLLGISSFSKAEILRMEAVVNADTLNVRKTNDTKSEIITSAKRNTKLNIITLSEDNNWFKVEIGGRVGWVDKKYVKTQVIGNPNYKLVSSIGNTGASSILTNSIKSTFNSEYKYILNFSEKYNLKIYDKNNNFVNSIEFSYPWVLESKDLNNIVLTVDDENNIYTNNNDRNTITKYDFKGLKNINIGSDVLGELSYIVYNPYDQNIYSLDNSTKSIKSFNKQGVVTKNIFLSETRVPKAFTINKNDIYVLDYPENETTDYQVYYVNTYSFVLRNNYDTKARVVETISKGSILKNDPDSRTYKNKIFIDNEQTKTKDLLWGDFSDKEKKFGIFDELKKVDVIGHIDIYSSNGNYKSNITLNDKWSLKSPDRHRNNENDFIRKIKGVIVDSNSNIILPILTNAKNSSFTSLNYYYLDKEDKSYKISQPIPYDGNNLTYFYDDNIYTSISKGHIISLNENGVEKEKIGITSPFKFNLASNISFNNNQLYVFDKMNYSIGKYDLNGEPIKVIYREQKSDLFNYDDIYFSKSKIFALKSLVVEDKKIGLEIFDEKFNKLYDKWLITLSNNISKPKISVNENEDIFIFATGKYYNKKVTLSMFTNKGHLLNTWEKEADIGNIFTEEDKKGIRYNSLKFLGFDNKANIYLLLKKGSENKIYKVKISSQGGGEVLKIFDADFLGELVINEDKSVNRKLTSSDIKSEILKIEEGKQGFTYMMVKDNLTRQVRMAILDPSGMFWKETLFSSYPDMNDFSLDQTDNLWFSQGNVLQKFANYN